jgi:HipA-like protein
MRIGEVYNNKVAAGIIEEIEDKTFVFQYYTNYLGDENMPAISLHFPKRIAPFESQNLFPFFYNMLSEGANKKIQSQQLKIDESDSFGFLLKTSSQETIGAIRVIDISTK